VADAVIAAPVTADGVEAAAARIAGRVRTTPILVVEAATFSPDPVALKLELLQHTGSFKTRGAFNRVLAATVPTAGLVAASGGNHGVAVAYVAQTLGHRAEIFVPSVSAATKVARIEGLGAVVTVEGDVYQEAQQAATARAVTTGALLVHPYDDPLVVAGQGTMARELDAQAPAIDTVLIAVGGGGLIGGAAAWFGDRVKLISVEPATIPAMHEARRAGRPVPVAVSGIAADSLGASAIGVVPFATAAPFLDEAVLVSDAAIVAAQRILWDRVRLMAEPGGAAALAALTSGAYRPKRGERVAVVVCGANVDVATVAGADTWEAVPGAAATRPRT
jgi:threonine dehydratase